MTKDWLICDNFRHRLSSWYGTLASLRALNCGLVSKTRHLEVYYWIEGENFWKVLLPLPLFPILLIIMKGQAIGQRYSQVGIPANTKTILSTKKPPAFRESFLFNYARFTGVVFLSWELSDELGKLPKGMAYRGRLRTHPTKRSVKRVSFGTISSAGSIPYGCFQQVVQSKSILWTNSFIAFIDRVE